VNEGRNDRPNIQVFEKRRFGKAIAKHGEKNRVLIEDEIDLIVDDPLLGSRKKGDLKHLLVHKFKIEIQEWLLGYNWPAGRLTIHLLQLGPHENYYREAKGRF
jgi:mRNA-degrading endonuclease RelE of RelBE toxin-antitoxin system